MSTSMEKFVTSIKKKYRERRLHREKQWPLRHSNKIINLLLVNRRADEGYFGHQQRGKPVEEPKQNLQGLDYSKLFEVKSGAKPVRKVLIEGDAGIGKTTFCLSLTEDWANGKIFQQFKLLFFLPLRDRVVNSARSLLELLRLLHSSTKLCEPVVDYLEEEEGKKVMIIADDWDELDKSGRQEGSFLYKLLFEDLPFASVILTSRPTASSSLRESPYIDRYVEIHGFNQVRSREYIQSEFDSDQEKAKRLLKQIEVTPFVESICSIPLNCAILCHLWRTREEALPITMTGLYTKIILNIILHNLQKSEPYVGIKSLAGFEVLPDNLVESWQLMCEFAYRAMEENQIVFSREELVSFFPQGLALDEKILSFGLLQSAEPILETGYGVSFHFLHQIFQEYLAAQHIVRQPFEKQLDIINLEPKSMNLSSLDTKMYESASLQTRAKFLSKCRRSMRFSSVWKFFCGIYFSESNVKAQLPNVEHLTDSLLTMIKHTSLMFLDGSLHLCLLAFEARNAIVSQKVIWSIHEFFQQFRQDYFKQDQTIESATKTLNEPLISPYDYVIAMNRLFQIIEPVPMVLGRPFLSAYDCAAIVYVISNIQEHIPLRLDFSWSCIGDDSVRALTDALVDKNGALKIEALNLSGNKLTEKVLGDLFHRASASCF